MVNYLEAVRALLQVGDVHFGWTEGPLSEITLKEGVVPPTEDAIQAKLAELRAEFDDQAYARSRESEYPSLQDCIHAILDNDLDALQLKRQAVKAKYPKP